jgi:hypothetical protein
LFSGIIRKTRITAVHAKTKWMMAEYHLFISTILFPGRTGVSGRGINARSLMLIMLRLFGHSIPVTAGLRTIETAE